MNKDNEQNAALEAERVAAESWYEEYTSKGWSVSKIATTTAFKAGIEYARAQLASSDTAALLREIECLKSAVLVSQRSAVAISKELRAQLAAPSTAPASPFKRELLALQFCEQRLIADDDPARGRLIDAFCTGHSIGSAPASDVVQVPRELESGWPKQECPVTGAVTDVDPEDMGMKVVPHELLERLAEPLPDARGWKTWHWSAMVEASKELRALLNGGRV